MREPYPRDLIGYGGDPPPAGWPNRARLALSFVLNYEEGGEASVLHGIWHPRSFCTKLWVARRG